MLYFHRTLFLKDERRRQILHDNLLIFLAPNWRFCVSSENRIVWTHYKRHSDILTTKTEPWNRTVWTPASNFRNQESDRANGPLNTPDYKKHFSLLLTILFLIFGPKHWKLPVPIYAIISSSFKINLDTALLFQKFYWTHTPCLHLV